MIVENCLLLREAYFGIELFVRLQSNNRASYSLFLEAFSKALYKILCDCLRKCYSTENQLYCLLTHSLHKPTLSSIPANLLQISARLTLAAFRGIQKLLLV